jgi:SAM-dependent methyltransferase
MITLIARIDKVFYPDFERNWDDCLFRERILAYVRRESVMLDLGAGAGVVSQMNFRGNVARVSGVDIDPRVVGNPMLDESRIADAKRIPYESDCFDVVFSDNVLEHLDKPDVVFCEVARVLKPGGVFLFKTPNKWHYIPTIARLTPHWFHQYVNRWRGRAEIDTFPTYYRANTCADIARIAERSGLQLEQVDFIEGRPEYLRVAWPTYLLGALYERLVNSAEALAPFRILLVGALRKPARCALRSSDVAECTTTLYVDQSSHPGEILGGAGHVP